MMEQWKPVKGYEGIYEVSSFGRVRSLDRRVNSYHGNTRIIRGKVLAPWTDRYGYHHVNFWKDCKMKSQQVHRLVASVFLPNPDNLPQVNHKNEDKTDNRADNLEWCDAEYNINFGNRSKKVSETRISQAMLGKGVEQLTISGQYIRTFNSINEASRTTGANKSVIVRCCKGRTQTAGGYRWRYAE